MDTRKGILFFALVSIFILNLIMPFRLFVLAQDNDRFRTFHFANNFADNRHPRFSGGVFGVWEEVGEHLWLVYDSKLDSGNTEIFTRVCYRGQTFWREPTRLTDNVFRDEYPVVKHVNDNPMVVWQTNRQGNFDLMFSIFDGNTWSTPDFITNNKSDDIHPELFVLQIHKYPQPDTTIVILMWERDQKLYWNHYSETGWKLPRPVTNDSTEQANPSFFAFQDRIFLVWESNMYGNWDIYGSWLDIGSNEWAVPIQLTFSEFDDRKPSIIHSYWDIGLIWQSNRDGNFEIYSRGWWRNEDSTFVSEPINQTMNDSADVDPYALFIPYGCVGSPALVWASNVSGAYEIYYIDGGELSWQLAPWFTLQLTHDSFLNQAPVISPVLRDTAWVAWESYHDNKWNVMGAAIYIQVGEVEAKKESKLSSTILFQNYPNPFNSSSNIRYILQRNDFVSIKIYNQVGQQVKIILDNKHETKGIHSVSWDGKDEFGVNSPSGIYFCRIKTTHYIRTKKMILIR